MGRGAASGPAIEALQAAEVDAVCRLARRTWQATYPGIISQQQIDAMLADRYTPAAILAQLGDPGHHWLIARDRDTIAGFAHARLDGETCKLDKLYVDPAHQRRGIGRALVDAIRAFARQQGAGRLWLQVNRNNQQAVRAYQSYGFDIIEARVFDIGAGFVMDDYVMESPT
jgi:ribosomal protein S18 acetylase RimI-like enzyme